MLGSWFGAHTNERMEHIQRQQMKMMRHAQGDAARRRKRIEGRVFSCGPWSWRIKDGRAERLIVIRWRYGVTFTSTWALDPPKEPEA